MTDTRGSTATTKQVIPIEWNWDMDTTTISLGVRGGQPPFSEFATKGRCKRCWGALRGRTDAAGTVTGIRCIVCDKLLEGTAAAAEGERISKESIFNALNMMLEHQPKYGDGPFAQKVFPTIDRLSEQELRDRVALSKSQHRKSPRGTLTRHEFPVGGPGWFFLQARALIDGLSRTIDHERNSIMDFPNCRINADGSVSVQFDTQRLSQNPRHREQELLARVGLLLGNGMIAAFACELALKAVSLTSAAEARKTHDLLELFDDLPGDSRDRLQADFSTIREVLTDHRLSFGTWRYFEADVGTDAFKAMTGPQPTRLLAKAARVILDEAEYVGLTGGITVHANRKVRTAEDEREHEETIKLTIKGGECPPRPCEASSDDDW
ncbi:MAG: hypothetical protein OXI84_05485 [bacterium]|nr:hypothetical protein [bacterium]